VVSAISEIIVLHFVFETHCVAKFKSSVVFQQVVSAITTEV